MLRFLLSLLIFWAIVFGIYSFFWPAFQGIAQSKVESEFQDRLSLALENSGVSIPAWMFGNSSDSESAENWNNASNTTNNDSENWVNSSSWNWFWNWGNNGSTAYENSGGSSLSAEERWKSALTAGNIHQKAEDMVWGGLAELEKWAKWYFGTPLLPWQTARRTTSDQAGWIIYDPAIVLPAIPSGLPPYYFGNTRLFTNFGETRVCMYLLDRCVYKYWV